MASGHFDPRGKLNFSLFSQYFQPTAKSNLQGGTGGADAGNHDRHAGAAQAVFEQHGQCTVPVGDVHFAASGIGQVGDADAKSQQAFVDIVGLDQGLTFALGAADTFATSQVNKGQ